MDTPGWSSDVKKPSRVLHVDDLPGWFGQFQRRMLRDGVEVEDYQGATNAKEARLIFEAINPDLVILDLNFPEGPDLLANPLMGLALLQELRLKAPEARFVIASGSYESRESVDTHWDEVLRGVTWLDKRRPLKELVATIFMPEHGEE